MVEERRRQYGEECGRGELKDGLKKGNKNSEERVPDGIQQATTAAGARQEEQKTRSPEWVKEGSAIYPPAIDTDRRLDEIMDNWLGVADRISWAKFKLEDETRATCALLRATGYKTLGYDAEIDRLKKHIKSLEPEGFKNDHPDRILPWQQPLMRDLRRIDL